MLSCNSQTRGRAVMNQPQGRQERMDRDFPQLPVFTKMTENKLALPLRLINVFHGDQGATETPGADPARRTFAPLRRNREKFLHMAKSHAQCHVVDANPDRISR